MDDWKDISDSELDYRKPILEEIHRKFRERDKACFNTNFGLLMEEQSTGAESWTDLTNQIKIQVPVGAKYLNIGAELKCANGGDPGEDAEVHIRFRIGSTYSTEAAYTKSNPGTGSTTVSCKIDVSSLSGEQTLYMQGYVTAGDPGTMYGSILERADSYLSSE